MTHDMQSRADIDALMVRFYGKAVYRRHGRSPLLVHADLHRKSPLRAEHFQRWLALFTEAVDESFIGMRAEYAKQRGHAIARRMLEFLSGPPSA